jgi:predicted ribosome quality control (RQC) complex YloA/Tae2 family protein
MRPFDYTTLVAVCGELGQQCLPARFEGAYQRDRHTLILGLRTLAGRGGLLLCWHPQFARLHATDAPPKSSDTFTFSKQLQSLLRGLALVGICPLQPWERVVDLQFALRPGDEVQWHLYLEIMGKHSNLMLVNSTGDIVTAGHQVSASQSRLRPIQTGQPYEPPPALQGAIPKLEESLERWQERLQLLPGSLVQQMVQVYRGVSTALAEELLTGVGIDVEARTEDLTGEQWRLLFQVWHQWLQRLGEGSFVPQVGGKGYYLLGLHCPALEGVTLKSSVYTSVQTLVAQQYEVIENRSLFQSLAQQLQQKLRVMLKKYRQKATIFIERLRDSHNADCYRKQGDLLMAHVHQWQPGLKSIEVLDFETNQPIQISLNPEKNGVQNAQFLYKQHQKLKRAKDAVMPLLGEIQTTIAYLEQVEESLKELEYTSGIDLMILREIEEELIEQGYLQGMDTVNKNLRRTAKKRSQKSTEKDSEMAFQSYRTPSGYEVWVGRNNRQNDQLSFRVATAYDLWFHTQEIPGSHVLLRLPAGTQPEILDLQYTANIAAYHSRARQSEQVPVVYTQPQHLYKPKGHPPGLVIYKQAEVMWGNPLAVQFKTLNPSSSL